ERPADHLGHIPGHDPQNVLRRRPLGLGELGGLDGGAELFGGGGALVGRRALHETADVAFSQRTARHRHWPPCPRAPETQTLPANDAPFGLTGGCRTNRWLSLFPNQPPTLTA